MRRCRPRRAQVGGEHRLDGGMRRQATRGDLERLLWLVPGQEGPQPARRDQIEPGQRGERADTSISGVHAIHRESVIAGPRSEARIDSANSMWSTVTSTWPGSVRSAIVRATRRTRW